VEQFAIPKIAGPGMEFVLLGSGTKLILPQYNRDPAVFSSYQPDPRTSPSLHRSPTTLSFPQPLPNYASSHAHPPSRHNSIPLSPAASVLESPVLSEMNPARPHQIRNSWDASNPSSLVNEDKFSQHTAEVKEEPEPKRVRTSDPMSFSSILSSNPTDPPKASTHKLPAVKQFQRKPHTPNGENLSLPSVDHPIYDALPLPADHTAGLRRPAKSKPLPITTAKTTSSAQKSFIQALSDKENEKVKMEMGRIDSIRLDDIEGPAWAAKKEEYALVNQKRQLDVDSAEETKRKVSVIPGC